MSARRGRAAVLGFAFFVPCFVAAAIVQAPAVLLDAAVAHYTEQRLRIVDGAGTIWRGRGSLTTASGHAHVPIEWRIGAHRLLLGALAGTLRIGAGAPVAVDAAANRLALGALDTSIPAALVAEGLGAHPSYQLGGRVRIRTPGLVIGRGSGSGRVEVEWLQARTGIVDFSFGSYRARVDLSPAGGRIELRTLEGPLALTGSGAWTAGGIAVESTARATGPDADRIAAWLGTMAPAQSDGSFRFVWPAPQRAGPSS